MAGGGGGGGAVSRLILNRRYVQVRGIFFIAMGGGAVLRLSSMFGWYAG